MKKSEIFKRQKIESFLKIYHYIALLREKISFIGLQVA